MKTFHIIEFRSCWSLLAKKMYAFNFAVFFFRIRYKDWFCHKVDDFSTYTLEG